MLFDLLRHRLVVDDDICFSYKKVFRRRLDAALFTPRHGMPRHIVHMRGQNPMQSLVDIALRAACVGEDRTVFQIGQDALDHRHNLKDGRAQIYNIHLPHHFFQIG